MKYKIRFALIVTTQLTSIIYAADNKTSLNIANPQIEKSELLADKGIKIGENLYIPLDDTLDEALEKSNIDKKNPRYTIGARSINGAQKAIEKLNSGKDLDNVDIANVLICYAAMKAVESGHLLPSGTPYFSYPSENSNVLYYSDKNEFHGFQGSDDVAHVNFTQLKDAFEAIKKKYVRLPEEKTFDVDEALVEIFKHDASDEVEKILRLNNPNKTDFQKDFSSVNPYWDGVLDFALNNGLKETWCKYFWYGKDEKTNDFMKKISTDKEFLKAAIVFKKTPMFRYLTQDSQSYNVTPLSLLRGLLSVYKERTQIILKENKEAQQWYDGIIKNIKELQSEIKS
ncbi:MAG: hypothetical protein CNLJKLNK_01195 [Holosporales bacterium]